MGRLFLVLSVFRGMCLFTDDMRVVLKSFQLLVDSSAGWI